MFPDELIEEIASIGIEISYKANEMLFNIDEPARNLAILINGRVDIMTTKRTQLVLVQNDSCMSNLKQIEMSEVNRICLFSITYWRV